MPAEQQPQPQSQQNVASSKQPSKHGHAASQAQPTPRKVRFNVGPYSFASIPQFRLALTYRAPRLSVPGPRCRRRGCLRYRLFCRPSPNRQKGCDQEDCPLRPFNVLFEDSSRAEAAQIPQRSWRVRKRKQLVVYTYPCPPIYARRLQIISILDIIKPPSIEAFKEVYCDYPSNFASFLRAQLMNVVQ